MKIQRGGAGLQMETMLSWERTAYVYVQDQPILTDVITAVKNIDNRARSVAAGMVSGARGVALVL